MNQAPTRDESSPYKKKKVRLMSQAPTKDESSP